MKAARLITAVLLLSVSVGVAFAAAPTSGGRRAKPLRAQDIDNAQTIDINNINMFITNTGSFAWDKTSGNAGLEFPKGTGKTAVFAAGLWMAAKVSGSVRAAVSEYSDEYAPGVILPGGAPDDPAQAKYHVYKL